MQQNVINALTKCPLFRDIGEQEIASIIGQTDTRTVRLPRHYTYCHSGDQCRHADIVMDGELAARMAGISGRQVEVIRIRQGDIIAPCFIYSSDRTLPVEIETVADTQILRMSPGTLSALADNNPVIRRNFIRTLSDISAYLATKIGFLSLMTIREKVAYYLRTEAIEQRSLHLRMDMSRQRMADSFAIQKFSLLRCLAGMVEEGIIRIDGKEIEIVDIRRLK